MKYVSWWTLRRNNNKKPLREKKVVNSSETHSAWCRFDKHDWSKIPGGQSDTNKWNHEQDMHTLYINNTHTHETHNTADKNLGFASAWAQRSCSTWLTHGFISKMPQNQSVWQRATICKQKSFRIYFLFWLQSFFSVCVKRKLWRADILQLFLSNKPFFSMCVRPAQEWGFSSASANFTTFSSWQIQISRWLWLVAIRFGWSEHVQTVLVLRTEQHVVSLVWSTKHTEQSCTWNIPLSRF